MNTLLFEPTDVLFFRDGRPMSGSLSGHGAAWPLPTVTSAALHAALHRAQVNGEIKNDQGKPHKVHDHDHHRPSGERVTDVRMFGSLVTAGPFPVLKNGNWLFPRPLDTGVTAKTPTEPERSSTAVTILPLADGFDRNLSSLPQPLKYAAASTLDPTKATPAAWWTVEAWQAYLDGAPVLIDTPSESDGREENQKPKHFYNDTAFADTEHSYGIGMDAATGTQDGKRFYSAHYLRLKPGCRLGLLAEARDKEFRDSKGDNDLIAAIFPNSGTNTPVIVGGQQRACTVQRSHEPSLPLPVGKSDDFKHGEKYLVKWVLLTPAIFPAIKADPEKGINAHPGGWLPNWIAEKACTIEGKPVEKGSLLLRSGDTERRQDQNGRWESREVWRARVRAGQFISATLVAAIVGKPVPVTGYALPHKHAESTGAKPTHLAVPAGSVYYFECTDKDAAQALANALNWHGATAGTAIKNRRSTLMGEKGYGLGVCGTWTYGKLPT